MKKIKYNDIYYDIFAIQMSLTNILFYKQFILKILF